MKINGGPRQLHDLLANLLTKWLRQAKIPHMCGVDGFRRTCKGLFTGIANQLLELDPENPVYAGALRYRQGILAPRRSTSPMNLAKIVGYRTPAELKALAPGGGPALEAR